MDEFSQFENASQAKLVRLYKTNLIARKNLLLKVWFLQRCLVLKVTPKFVNIRCTTHSGASLTVLNLAKRTWIKEEIKQHYRTLNQVNSRLKYLYFTLTLMLPFVCFLSLDYKFREDVEDFGKITYHRLSKKLFNLRQSLISPKSENVNARHESDGNYFHKRFLNLSNTSFTPQEENLLNLNLKFNFALKVDKKKKETLAVEAENIIQSCNIHNKNILRAKIINFLNSEGSNNTPTNFNPTHLKSLKNKITSNNLLVTKADKGNCLVVMNKENYIDKITDFLSSEDFEEINKDPTFSFFSKVKASLDRCLVTLEYFGTNKCRLYPMNPRTPVLYGLPKIHKEDIPIRPVVSFVDSPVYRLSSWLNDTLREVTGFKNQFSIKNSIDFANYLNQVTIPDNAILLSLDVKNLFPSIPSQECISLVESLLFKTKLPKVTIENLVQLLSLVLEQNFFKFNNKFYKQRTGLAMGSCLSPFLSEVFMCNLENIIMSSRFSDHLRAYKRYVDDICILWVGSELELSDFLTFVNSLHPNISFTLEREIDRRLPFLDLLLCRNDGTIDFEVYRKPTATDNIIQFSSNSPQQHKFSAFNSMLYRLFKLPLSKSAFDKEFNTIKTIATNNNFSLSSLNKLYFKFFNRHKLSYHIVHTTENKEVRILEV